MLSRLSIRRKIALILLLPAAVIVLLAWLRVGSTIATSRRADRVTQLTEFALRGTTLAYELQKERGLSLRWLLGGKVGVDRGALLAQRDPVDRAVASYQASARTVDQPSLAAATRDRLVSAGDRLDGLAGVRRDLDRRTVSVAATLDYYDTTIADLLNTNRGLAAGIADPELAQSVGAFVAVSRITELAALERELITTVLHHGRFAAGEYPQLTSTLATRAVLLAEFRASVTDAQRALYVDTLVGPEVQRARELQATAVAAEAAAKLDIDPVEWWTVTSAEIDLLHQVEGHLGAASAARSQRAEATARSRATADGVGILLALAVAVGLSLLVARSLVRPLGQLKAAAEDVAHTQLPGVVDKLQRAEPVDLDVGPPPIGIRSRDEIGQVSRAFDTVHSVAVQVAAEQAALRRSVGDMFLNLGRRLQTLVGRQLEQLDELERTEVDPKQLQSLFRLDHLATRMRRNAENLLVLSGAEPVRRWSQPVPLVRVIRAAAAEIEDYARVVVLPMPDADVVGHAVSDVVHLLAELIENAAVFSPPGTRVQVTGEPTPHGYLLEIEDQGIGMTAEELAKANQQLANPPAIDLARAQRLGFYVVGRLAARDGIKVRLRRSWFGGLAALVLLPLSLLGEPFDQAAEADGKDAGPAEPEPMPVPRGPRAFAVGDPAQPTPDGAPPAVPGGQPRPGTAQPLTVPQASGAGLAAGPGPGRPAPQAPPGLGTVPSPATGRDDDMAS
jgi:signal transduction histidine kinase